MKPHWEHFSHQADIGVRGQGETLEQAFEQAALALCAVITEPEKVVPLESFQVDLEAPDPELLFVDWLNRLVYEMAVRNMLFSRFSVRIDGEKLSATVWGEGTDKHRHEPAVEIKGATFTELHVFEGDGMWQAQCVVDV